MVIPEQYNNRLFVHQSADAVYLNGEWMTSDGSWSRKSECRYEPNGKGNTISIDGVKAITFSGIVYAPVITYIPEGEEVIVLRSSDVLVDSSEESLMEMQKSGELLIRGTILKCDVESFHTRIWVN